MAAILRADSDATARKTRERGCPSSEEEPRDPPRDDPRSGSVRDRELRRRSCVRFPPAPPHLSEAAAAAAASLGRAGGEFQRTLV